VDLVAAAIEQLAEQRIEAWRQTADTLPDTTDARLPALLDRLWDDFSGPLFVVFVKLWIAAADDPELYARLATVEREIARAISRLATDTIGDLTDRAGWESRLRVALSAVRGLALNEHFEPRTEALSDPWPSAREVLIELFRAGAAGADKA
jgi:AcrR family transcriptional regulator